jgi:DNA-binding FadR family transcriptional regulator
VVATLGQLLRRVAAEALRNLLILLAPFAPHLAEELWQRLGANPGGERSIHRHPWPVADPEALLRDTIPLVVQVKGKVRGSLDALAVRLAVERGARLDEAVMHEGRLAENARDLQGMIQADLAFHRAIYEASGNPLIAQSIDLHWHHLKRVMGAVLQSSHQRQTVWDEHQAIAQAIAAGDADQAVRLVQEHANEASVQLTARLSEQIQHLKTGAPT